MADTFGLGREAHPRQDRHHGLAPLRGRDERSVARREIERDHEVFGTVMLLNGRGIWKLRAMPRRVRTCGGNRVMSSPRNTTVPASVRNAPEMQLISVVLPEPFGPIRPKRSPGRMSTLTLSSAVKPPKRLVSADIRSRGALGFGSHHPSPSVALAANLADQANDALRRADHEQHQHHAEHQHVHFRRDGDGQQLLRRCPAGSRRPPGPPNARCRRSATSRAPRPSS